MDTYWITVVASILSVCSASSEQHVAPNIGKSPDLAGDVPKGHLLPFGDHRPSEGTIATVEGYPDPITFHKTYYEPAVPVLFKNAAKDSPAFQKWTDDYLRKTYGDLLIDTEIAKKENRTKGVKQMKFAKFLDKYGPEDIYMVQDSFDEMKGDISLPKPIICGGYKEQLATAIIWFSSGGTKSVLHNDDIDNINCLLDGSKRFQMIDRKYRNRIEGQYFVFRRGYSRVDVDKVDMYKFPGLQDLPWYDVTMEKGDCLFIPSRWYHIVDSAGPRNMAVNAWFRHLDNFDSKDCEGYNGEFPDHTSLEGLKLGGMEELVTGPEGEDAAEELEEEFGLGPDDSLTADDLFWEWRGWEAITKDDFKAFYMQEAPEMEIHMAFGRIDKDSDGVITWEELRASDVDLMVDTFSFLLPPQRHHPLDPPPGDDQDQLDKPPSDKDEL